ncbi:MAG: helix-turn-helix transcriptional regulator [Saprospiraceae bacterium]|nr:helix-turn-helix transcriptional regulator [Saprospiraceae bacterium]
MLLKISLRAKKPSNPAYPTELNTLGDYLRKTRLDRGLSQPEVARILNVTPDTVTGWELNRHEPPARLSKAIIAFLGFCPHEGKSPGKELKCARLITGKTQREVAEMIGCDASNLRYIELDKRKPQPKTLEKIQDFINSALSSLSKASLE